MAMTLRPGGFFLPGPTEVSPPVLQAQTRPVIGHRGPAIQALMATLQEGLKEVFRTERPVFISTSSATGMMEAGVRNAARRRVLSLVNGAFSERFAEISRACGFETHTLEVPWGSTHDPDQLRDRLGEGEYDTVTVVHSETSTGALNDIRALAEVVGAFPDTVLLVDSVTGVGGAEVQSDAWCLDYVLTGSQKALALPPGLSFAVASGRVMERSARAAHKGLYFDLEAFAANLEKHQTPTTPAVNLLFALEVQLGRVLKEGMEARWARHQAMQARCVRWVEEMRRARGVALEILAPEGARSPTVTCIALPEGLTGPQVAQAMASRGFVIGTGYGRLKPTHIRIGHMGDHTVAELDALLLHLEEVLIA